MKDIDLYSITPQRSTADLVAEVISMKFPGIRELEVTIEKKSLTVSYLDERYAAEEVEKVARWLADEMNSSVTEWRGNKKKLGVRRRSGLSIVIDTRAPRKETPPPL